MDDANDPLARVYMKFMCASSYASLNAWKLTYMQVAGIWLPLAARNLHPICVAVHSYAHTVLPVRLHALQEAPVPAVR
jgi:hypothetical protein